MKIHEQLRLLNSLKRQEAQKQPKPVDLNPNNSANPEPRTAKKKAKRKTRRLDA